MNFFSPNDTIAAIATPRGSGGVGVVRISGELALTIAIQLLGRPPIPRHATLTKFIAQDQTVIDQGLLLYFPAPDSFTGEHVLELQGHGGVLVMEQLLQRMLELGARLAQPGEFTARAFLNNKIDLIQAEAVADLINASTVQAARNAARSLSGEFSHYIERLLQRLVRVRAQLELAIDFVEEELTVSSHYLADSQQQLKELLVTIAELKNTTQQGLLLQEGIRVVILGKPNAGKSSLLNCLAGEDVAIVSNIPGTTRDVLRQKIQLDGVPIYLLDTAGLNDHPDLLEREGIRRAWEEVRRADHLLFMVDASVSQQLSPEDLLSVLREQLPKELTFTILYNKIDLNGLSAKTICKDKVTIIYLSIKQQIGLTMLKEHLKSSAGLGNGEVGFSARRRHVNAIAMVEQSIHRTQQLIEYGVVELAAEELRQAQHYLGEITGAVTNDDLLTRIFADFCVGK